MVMKQTLLLFLLFATLLGSAQKLEYNILFEGIGDNREFTAPLGYPQTILGTRGAFELGVSFEEHRLRGGLSHLFEFGSDIDVQKPKLTLYYQFQDDKTEFIFGAFPRRDKIDFPLVMLTDTLLYYRPNVEGFYASTSWDWGKQSGFVDWVGRQTDIQREQFMVGLSGEIFHKNLFAQNYVLLFHDAETKIEKPDEHIRDYFGYLIMGGIRTNETSKFRGEFKAGVLSSLFRERTVTDGFITNSSLYLEMKGRYKKFSVKSVLTGGNHIFKYGDPLYKADDYWRTDVVWHFIEHKNIKAKFNLSFHLIDFDYLDQQQQLSVIYSFGK